MFPVTATSAEEEIEPADKITPEPEISPATETVCVGAAVWLPKRVLLLCLK